MRAEIFTHILCQHGVENTADLRTRIGIGFDDEMNGDDIACHDRGFFRYVVSAIGAQTRPVSRRRDP